MKRIAIIDENRCKPNKCNKECIGRCPPQRTGQTVIEIEDIGSTALPSTLTNKKQIAKIVEESCIGCNQCVKACPFQAIQIVNLPTEMPDLITHRYSANGFRLYKLPIIGPNKIIGIVGQNGVGKTTVIDILSNHLTPNFEIIDATSSATSSSATSSSATSSSATSSLVTSKQIVTKFRGTSLQNYFTKLYNNQIVVSVKQQKIKQTIRKCGEQLVRSFITNDYDEWFIRLELNLLLDKQLNMLSGGELQRLLCWITASATADMYIFDEPTNFLDIRQRIIVSNLISSLKHVNKYVVVIEHDLSILDYMADEIYIVYGQPGVYGIVSNPLTPLAGINMYLDGYIPFETIRFRQTAFNLKPTTSIDASPILSREISSTEISAVDTMFSYNSDIVSYTHFALHIPDGTIRRNSLNVILGENGTGKTTFIEWIHRTLGASVSIKQQTPNVRQYINASGTYPTVKEVLCRHVGLSKWNDSNYQSDVIRKLDIHKLQSMTISNLSGGELQKVMIALCLGKNADIYLLDEPSANLDIENRLKVIYVIKKFMDTHVHKCCFVIEHDIMMAVSLSQESYSNILLVTHLV